MNFGRQKRSVWMDELRAVDRTKFWINIQMKSSEEGRASGEGEGCCWGSRLGGRETVALIHRLFTST